MKKIIKYLFLLFLAIGINSCSEDKLLNLSPINDISNDAAYSTPSLIESSVNGMYNAAALGQYNSTTFNGGRGYVWGAAFVQQGDCRGEDVVNTATFYQLTYTNTHDPTTANNVYYWVDGFRLINRCNLVIEGVNKAVQNGVISAAVGNDYIGQAKFLRAITHFELCLYFAQPYHLNNGSNKGLPYREAGIDTQDEVDQESAKPRLTVAEVYQKVLADLNEAENLITNTTMTKATKNAAIAFKTRVYLHMRNWDKVIEEGNKIKSAYQLEAAPSGVWANNYTNKESIFSLRHNADYNPGVNAALASQYNRRLLVAISPIIWRDPSWLSDDLRRKEATDGTGMVFTSGGRKYTNKYRDVTTYTDAAPIIRYAEVVLNMAEAYARKSDLANGLTLLNSVRDRSLANKATQTYTAELFADNKAMVEAIIKERRIEFLMEGRRWADIHRLQQDDLVPMNGIPAKRANGNPAATEYDLASGPYAGPYGVAALPGSEGKFIWPIPQIELNVNPGLGQNPGY